MVIHIVQKRLEAWIELGEDGNYRILKLIDKTTK